MENLFKSKKCDVLGLGISNIPLVRYLLDEGAAVRIHEKKEYSELDDGQREFIGKAEYVCGANYLDGIDGDYVFRSPGIRPDLPEIQAAVERGATLTSEMELFFYLCPCRIIAVTGSDGKTTTTTLISEILAEQYGRDRVFVGGNIGEPLLPRVRDMTPRSIVVVELSSFQLMQLPNGPDICVVTNVSPNHLNWHKDMDEYVWAKGNIFRNMHGGRVVLNAANEYTKKMAEEVPEDNEILWFNGIDCVEIPGAISCNGVIALWESDIFIRGHHNVENYMAAIAATWRLVENKYYTKVAKEFKGVAHRIEFVRELDGVRYYDSSIDSSPSRAIACINSFRERPIVILGGRDKHVPFDGLAELLVRKAKTVILTGEAADQIKKALDNCECDGEKPPILMVPDFLGAVIAAKNAAESGDVVLLSPACTSFDVFKNFEQRGDRFKEIVNGF